MNTTLIKFKVNGEERFFKVEHDMGEQIHSAVDAWLSRTRKFNGKSFCAYIRLKGVHKCKLI